MREMYEERMRVDGELLSISAAKIQARSARPVARARALMRRRRRLDAVARRGST